MKPIKYIGVALVASAALGVVACNTESLSAPDFNGTNSSAVEKSNPQSSSELQTEASSSSEIALSSGTVETCVHFSDLACEPCPPGIKCTCNPCDPQKMASGVDCHTGNGVVCIDGEWAWKSKSDSTYSTPAKSSSSVAKQSSSSVHLTTYCNGMHVYEPIECPEEKCRDFKNMCPPCDPVVGCNLTNVPCNQCNPDVDSTSSDCETGMKYVCKNRLWTPVEDPNETCKHITDFEGSYSCANQNGSTAVDCITGSNFQCKSNRWETVSCMNIKPDECKPGMGGCGYRLCQRNGIKEIADCENSVVYVCNGEMWEVKKTEKNQHCARGELEYCDACFEEGKFEGHYKCEGGKWRKYGMGDDICEHITDVKCEFGNDGCGACDAPENKEVRDCATGQGFVCQDNFWTALVVDCDALIPECGYSEYELCTKYNLKEYCNDKWLSEPCDGKESSRDLVVYENGEKLTNRGGNYICVNGKWIERFRYYECGEKEDCVPESVRCQASPAIGTACDNDGVPAEFDGCTLICSGGAYLYAPPPVW